MPLHFQLQSPVNSGYSVNYLIQACLQESDQDPMVLPYYNASNPSQPYSGPTNSGLPQATLRSQSVQLQLKEWRAIVGRHATYARCRPGMGRTLRDNSILWSDLDRIRQHCYVSDGSIHHMEASGPSSRVWLWRSELSEQRRPLLFRSVYLKSKLNFGGEVRVVLPQFRHPQAVVDPAEDTRAS